MIDERDIDGVSAVTTSLIINTQLPTLISGSIAVWMTQGGKQLMGDEGLHLPKRKQLCKSNYKTIEIVPEGQ